MFEVACVLVHGRLPGATPDLVGGAPSWFNGHGMTAVMQPSARGDWRRCEVGASCSAGRTPARQCHCACSDRQRARRIRPHDLGRSAAELEASASLPSL